MFTGNTGLVIFKELRIYIKILDRNLVKLQIFSAYISKTRFLQNRDLRIEKRKYTNLYENQHSTYFLDNYLKVIYQKA